MEASESIFYLFVCYIFHSHLRFFTFFLISLSLPVVPQIRGQSLLPPHYHGSCLAVYRQQA